MAESAGNDEFRSTAPRLIQDEGTMGIEENKALALRFVEEVYNQGQTERVDDLVSPDFVRHGIGGTMRGRQIIKDRVAAMRAGFPDFHISVEEVLAEGTKSFYARSTPASTSASLRALRRREQRWRPRRSAFCESRMVASQRAGSTSIS